MVIDLAKEILSNLAESGSELNKLGNTKAKGKSARFEKYDQTLDVSMNEQLIHRFSRRKSKDIDTLGIPNNSIEQETVVERMAKVTSTSGEIDFKKIRKEACCRICLGGEEDEDINENPLITPCNWSGTMQYIHLEWLRKWLESKIHTKLTEFTFSYNWKNLICELCGMRLKDNYFVNGKITYVLDYLRPKAGNYMILESYTNTPHKTIHVLLSDKHNNPDNVEVEYWVGRANEAAVRITDISVSRLHATITYSNGSFYVKDEDAKFGTLLYLKEPVIIPPNKSLQLNLQIGRFAINITTFKDKTTTACLDSEYGDDESTYKEDAPFLPLNLLNNLEQESIKLGLKDQQTNFDELQKIRNIKMSTLQKGEEDTNSQMVPGSHSTMMMNTMRNVGLDTQQHLPLQEHTRVQRRNSDLLDNTLDALGQNLQSMDIDEEDLQAPRRRQAMNTEIDSEDGERRPELSSTRMQMHTELGIMVHNNQVTNPSPNNNSTAGDITIQNSQRMVDSSSRFSNRSMKSKSKAILFVYQNFVPSFVVVKINSIRIMVDIEKEAKPHKITEKRENPNMRSTRARMMNLTLGNEENDEQPERIEERKSEQDEDDYQNQWLEAPPEEDRIRAFEPLESNNSSPENDQPIVDTPNLDNLIN